ncbi:DNA repair protein RecO [Paraliomyxa miuraensis]|uniref:DNA repair protein RecO n=1 Tax=Paraliomyxa miuraensis TaxID=376150 RepID=UPI0022527A1B|nr:DNA repair protein RecO [Paraliomyxa miuraensis]MCX4244427.1 DNA repair protein RecO [Paraliomyxa miuraensis]
MILATRGLGEADLLVVLLTPGQGKVRAAARHARKSRRRFPGGLSGGAVGEATVAMRGGGSSGGGLARLEAFTPVRDHGALGRDLSRFAHVAYLCELTDGLLYEPQPDPAVFSALCEAIGRTMEHGADAGTLRRYELWLLRALGLLPALDGCAVCGDELAPGPTVLFDEAHGGALCPLHGRGARRIPVEVLAAAVALLVATTEPEVDQALRSVAARPAGDRRGLRDLVLGWLRPHLRHPLRSREFFVKLGPSAPEDG